MMSSTRQQPPERGDSPLICLGSADAPLPPLPHTPTSSVVWDKILSDMNVESRELRRAIEKRAQRIAVMEEELHKLVDHNAGVMLAIERVDRQIKEVLEREDRLHHLAATAKKRKAKLQLDLEEAEKKLLSLAEYDSPAKSASILLVSPSLRAIADKKHQLETDRINKEKHEVAELQRKLYDAKSRYRKLCAENKKLLNALSSMKAEEREIISRRNENSVHNNSSNSESRIEFRAALQDLMESLEEVIHAGKRRF
ncbi:uncharacterized protein TM35_001981020 [Trypanosoma theileri]|uniref:Uncharacterized protein n=1 Tax=Trypanosoma theileri TaxID=67003 RepID=A0A1X0ND58_9TRYP|nr:uncharacterized protein TM35_001981020 [Trypanosoma theileri]ORC79869.1 hypothetical protein TM35_001981020 [Trypanosoma theileri]